MNGVIFGIVFKIFKVKRNETQEWGKIGCKNPKRGHFQWRWRPLEEWLGATQSGIKFN